MVGLFYIHLPMSFSIPQQIEKDIIAGRAQYRTFQTGNGGQSILQVPTNSYAVIYGYDFSPAGGGVTITGNNVNGNANEVFLSPNAIRFFETQQISFYTGSDFYPFIHHVNSEITNLVVSRSPATGIAAVIRPINSIDTTPISRQVYITSNKDVTITHGLILTATPATTGTIPVTSRTPGFLTYGGSPQLVQAQTNYGPVGTPQQFMQPSPKDFQDFGLGLLPGNPNDQAFATPDVTNGLIESNAFLNSIGPTFAPAAATNYYLCLHYALYTEVVPEQRG